MKYPILVMDFETTGLDIYRDYPLQLGVTAIYENFDVEPVGEWNIRAPIRALARRNWWSDANGRSARSVNGIRVRDALLGYYSPADVVRDLELLRFRYPSHTIAAQNVAFDYNVLKRMYQRVGYPCKWDYHTLDIPTLASATIGVSSLQVMCEKLGVETDKSKLHSAGYDSFVEAQVLVKILDRMRAEKEYLAACRTKKGTMRAPKNAPPVPAGLM